jgi:hypothetical protein
MITEYSGKGNENSIHLLPDDRPFQGHGDRSVLVGAVDRGGGGFQGDGPQKQNILFVKKFCFLLLKLK